jgi:hypothetical protein
MILEDVGRSSSWPSLSYIQSFPFCPSLTMDDRLIFPNESMPSMGATVVGLPLSVAGCVVHIIILHFLCPFPIQQWLTNTSSKDTPRPVVVGMRGTSRCRSEQDDQNHQDSKTTSCVVLVVYLSNKRSYFFVLYVVCPDVL